MKRSRGFSFIALSAVLLCFCCLVASPGAVAQRQPVQHPHRRCRMLEHVLEDHHRLRGAAWDAGGSDPAWHARVREHRACRPFPGHSHAVDRWRSHGVAGFR